MEINVTGEGLSDKSCSHKISFLEQGKIMLKWTVPSQTIIISNYRLHIASIPLTG